MKIDSITSLELSTAIARAREAETSGYDAMWVPESSRDPFLPLALAAQETDRIQLGTSVAIAFARSPMTLANTAYDLTQFSRGRFTLGLGSQIRPHITRRFSMEWSKPAARMREMVSAMRAIWECWMTGGNLDFQGDFYSHTLMTPFFDPGPHEYGVPRVFLAGVGPRMTHVAGEVADGFFCHGFSTEKFMREVTFPALEAGRHSAGKTMEGFDVCYPALVATGITEEHLEVAKAATRSQIAFYGSTPAYRVVLDHHGYGELHEQLKRMSKEGRWHEMGGLVDDALLAEFAVVGEPDAVAAELHRRYGELISRLSFYLPYDAPPELLRRLQTGVRAAVALTASVVRQP